MRLRPAIAALFVFAGVISLHAHNIEVRPVDVELRVFSDRVEARVFSNADYWKEEILGMPALEKLPATGWKDTYQSRARDYLNKAFPLQWDGQSLSMSALSCRYTEEPFSVDSARVVFDATYPVPTTGRRLSGAAMFFFEEIPHRTTQAIGEQFHTRLSIIGTKTITFDLTPRQPVFDFPLEGMRVTEGQRAFARVRAVLKRIFSSAFFWIALIFIISRIHGRFFNRRHDQ